ncbi:MAG: CDP-diacylglycerol--serine O-phosphatidyltransferase [bacterium]|nr:CDP-diacylglycerol--serine O-phosphatidyltransferase [bacterium]
MSQVRFPFYGTVPILPNLFTAANLVLGIRAITLVLRGDQYYDHAAICIMLAMLCDVMDGLTARISNAVSRFGVEFDSLADLTTFGIAPAVMVYRQALVSYDAANGRGFAHLGFFICAIYAGCAAMRLARFNTRLAEERTVFLGLPTPAAAGVIAAYFMLAESALVPAAVTAFISNWILPYLTAALGILMVSNIQYPAPLKRSLWRRRHFIYFALATGLLALVIASRGATLFALFSAYVVWGLVQHVRRPQASPADTPPSTFDEDDD